MHPRTAHILETVIREFIATGEPVSSKQIYDRYNFDVKSATIRNELNALTSDGYLEQIHISSGRVPTDKGYKFLVDKLIKEKDFKDLKNKTTPGINQIKKEITAGDLSETIEYFASRLQALSLGINMLERSIYKSSLAALLNSLNTSAHETSFEDLCEIVEDFETLEDKISSLTNVVESTAPTVFIGKSPIMRSRHLSVIAEKFDLGDKQYIVVVIGPKRMDYEKNIQMFSKFKRDLESLNE
ncbi:MAG: hypothetical protein COU07_00145 [Candidatus Harrisonbacteria bacterium CG10_big_fil_rev_8_21_14_0_10_40_38]|uniref:Heat-inducible transcription repressor HrcA C-terminal domain-containing protein n=1 Tax=Candidatus Harrisonbacteria bacterium CG10_big_fil_rev_8_21_14_0_10_40_38 TaxID=1974583 RepID=A0A2H0USA6_9BACT|nr:MAG: hypothetical protein COU07_00145 [Candidatus Harrisonbacteria bacterium CG10_big_fil_rev_8_21_14_0_10_40_38]